MLMRTGNDYMQSDDTFANLGFQAFGEYDMIPRSP